MFGNSFLEKEAALRFSRNPSPRRGFTPGETGLLNHNGLDIFDEAAIAEKKREEMDSVPFGNGVFGGAALGALGFLTPKKWGAKEKAMDGIAVVKGGIEKADTKIGAPLAGGDLNSMRGKLWSIEEQHHVGNKTDADGRVNPVMVKKRRPSALAPLQHASREAGPILGSLYLGEKMYPIKDETELKAAVQGEQEKKAEVDSHGSEKHGILDEAIMIERLDKQAALQKVARLEEKIEEITIQLEDTKEEKNLLWKQAEYERSQKAAVSQEKEMIQNELFEKEAAFEELKLRTAARERSSHAVKIAEGMLESGMIKQANFNDKVDFLMDCDGETFKLYASMVKEAENKEKGLESSAYMVDYINKDEDSAARQWQSRGKSKRGQTIGEAAKDLNNR